MLAIVNAKVRTCGSLGTLSQGMVLVRDKKIVAVGENLYIPEGMKVFDANGMVMTPGFIDAHTHMGMSWQELAGEADTNESTGVFNSHLQALDSVDPKDVAFDDAIAGGVTTVMVHPGKLMIGDQNISPVAGQSVVLKTHGTVGQREVLRNPAAMKLAVGDDVTAFLSSRRMGPNSRMGVAALLRGVLREAQSYAGQKPQERAGHRDLRMEALEPLLDGQIAAHVHVHRSDDILVVLRLADEFGIRVVLEHATEAYLVADELATRGVPCVVGPITVAREKHGELKNLSHRTPGRLAAAGVKVALMTNHPTEPIQFLPVIAGEAVGYGMDHVEALKAITLNAAEILGVSDRVGSIEAGKDADLVVHDGDPLEAMTHIRLVVADGEVVVNSLESGRES